MSKLYDKSETEEINKIKGFIKLFLEIWRIYTIWIEKN